MRGGNGTIVWLPVPRGPGRRHQSQKRSKTPKTPQATARLAAPAGTSQAAVRQNDMNAASTPKTAGPLGREPR